MLKAEKVLKAKMAVLMVPALLVATALPASAQDRDYRDNGNFHQGLRERGNQGYYNGEHRPQYRPEYRTQYNDGYYNRGDYRGGDYRENRGIGPGQGALIGGAGGAVLGALLGQGLGGALVGGAAGAGIGAIAGQAHQNHERDQYGYPR